jgi:general stress protein 26
MEVHAMTGFIPWSKVDIWLQAYRSIWLSTTCPDGRPHCVPLWFIWLGSEERIYFVTHYKTVKVGNLAHQPHVVLTAGNADDTIIIEGTAHLVADEAERQRINHLWMQKYVDPHSGIQATVTDPDDRLYRVEISHIMVWEYGIVDTRTDWRFT